MKVSTAFKIVIVFSCIVLSQANLSTKVKAILDKYIPPSIHLSTVVYSSSSSCNGFWATNGLACNRTRLLAHVTADAQNLTRAEVDFNKTLGLIQSFVVMITPDVRKHMPASLDFLTYITTDSSLNYIRASSTACWNYMKKIRANSVCSTCAGINFKFYQDLKGGLALSDCDALFGICETFIGQLRSIQIPRNVAYNTFKKMDPQYRIPDITYSSPGYYTYLQITILLEKYVRALSTDPNKKIYKAQICEGIIRINNPSILQTFTDVLRFDADKIISDYASLKARGLHLRRPSSRDIAARSLQGYTFTSEIDVLIGIPDALQPSIFVTSSGLPFTAVPMNLSLCFP